MAETTDVEREHDLERFLTFIDAIVAIAITLLVLPLVDLVTDLGDGQVSRLLVQHQNQFWAFLLSFVVIARLWLVQRRTISHLVRLDQRVVWALLLWTLTVVFLPFPTGLVAAAPDQPLTKGLYIGTVLLSVVSLVAAELVIVRRPELSDGSGEFSLETGLVNTGLLALALVVALVFPVTSYLPMLLLSVDGQVVKVVDRLRRG